MSDSKEESSSVSSIKEEDDSKKMKNSKTGESSKESDKDSDKNSEAKKESDKEDSENENSEDESDEEGRGLYDRPVEMSGCRARKQVVRLEVSFTAPKEKNQPIPEGRGKKLGECPRIEYHIQKNLNNDLKPLHKILFNRVGTLTEVKRNIRKFSGFTFDKQSPEYEKKKTGMEKLHGSILKHICVVLDIEQGGSKEVVVNRLLEFLMEPKESGKALPKKKKSKKNKNKSLEKTKKMKNKKETVNFSEDESNEASDNNSEKDAKEDTDNNDDDSDASSKSEPPKKKQKKNKASKKKRGNKTVPKELKRTIDNESDSSEDDDDEPVSKKEPSDNDLKRALKKILKHANLEEITVKKVLKQIQQVFPSEDLTDRKDFLKASIKSIVNP